MAQLTQQQLQTHLANNIAPLYVLTGDEPLSQTECLDAIRQAARNAGAEERTSLVAERQFNWQSVQQFSQTLSLFSAKQILEISIPSGKPGIEGGKVLTALANAPLADTTTIIILPTLDRDGKNSSWFSALKQQAFIIELTPVTASQLPEWIAKRLALQQQSADQASLVFMAHQLEGHLLAAHQEIQKLGLLYPAGKIDAAAINAAILNVSRYDAFQLGEAVLIGDAERAARILQGLQDEGEAALAVMSPLTWVLRPLIRIKLAQKRGENLQQAMANARLFGERQQLVKQALARFSVRQLEAALQKLCDIDKIAKGVMQGDAWLELSRLCFGLARVRNRPRIH